jgi:anti-sigma B factor antagonist
MEPLRVPIPEIDLATAAALRTLLRDCDPTAALVLDFTDVRFCDSNGIGVLVEAWHRHADAGGSVRVANPAPHIRSVFDLMGLTPVLLDEPADIDIPE